MLGIDVALSAYHNPVHNKHNGAVGIGQTSNCPEKHFFRHTVDTYAYEGGKELTCPLIAEIESNQ